MLDGFPAVMTAGPGANWDAAHDAAFSAHEREQGRGNVLRAVRRCPGRDAGPQTRNVRAQLRARRLLSSAEPALDAILQVREPVSDVAVNWRFGRVALQSPDELPTQHRGDWCADGGLHGRDVRSGEEEERTAHRHPSHQIPPHVHGL